MSQDTKTTLILDFTKCRQLNYINQRMHLVQTIHALTLFALEIEDRCFYIMTASPNYDDV